MTSLSDDTKITQRTCHPRAAATWPWHYLRPTSWPICCKKKLLFVCASSHPIFFFWFIILFSSHLPTSFYSSTCSLVADFRFRTKWEGAETRGICRGRHNRWEMDCIYKCLINRPPPTRHVNLSVSVPTPLSPISPCLCYTVSGPRSWLWLTGFRKSQGNLLKPPFLVD